MQTETTMLYDSTPIRRSKKIVITLNVDEKMEKWDYSSVANENAILYSHARKSEGIFLHN